MDWLSKALDEFEADENISCFVLPGSDKAFAAGADISAIRSMDYVTAYKADFITRNWERLKTFRKPVISLPSLPPVSGHSRASSPNA
jgi:enoyl-CoA hydratase/carnithine racemase